MADRAGRARRPPRGRAVAVAATVWWWTAAGPAFAVASVDQTVTNITNWIVGLLAGLATLFLTLGGLRYLMGAGEPGEVEKAKGALRSAAVGYMLAVLAPVLVGVLKKMVGA